MSKVIEDGLKHFRAKAARYRKLAEKAEAEVARLEALSQGSNPTKRSLDAWESCPKCGELMAYHSLTCDWKESRQ